MSSSDWNRRTNLTGDNGQVSSIKNCFSGEPRDCPEVGSHQGSCQEAEKMRRDDESAGRVSRTDATRQPLLNVKGGLSVRSVRKAQEFLNENFSRKLALAEMAAVCGLSPYHFVRAFSRTFGMPPHQYVLDLRLDFAEKLLADSRMSIADIAHLSGFSSQSHFTTVMKKYRHVTPMQARLRKVSLRSGQ
ncbi:AraC family transcriptional regulator [Mesorhizobium sp. B2-4-15]|uniref:helix-turn-helix domain-containing protein n=1 Tax=Mesorhizobium sp. B2-4-15 TaxID=2589934 RepID=UPI001FED40B8|nr:AraC family transcriptional regulator [Mesorhizobium sp. B2-4-15]